MEIKIGNNALFSWLFDRVSFARRSNLVWYFIGIIV
jgi:hypothetical protein